MGITEKFDIKSLDKIYDNLERIPEHKSITYRVRGDNGSDAGIITFLEKNDIRVYVDNFPFEKKYFHSNYPVRNIKDLESDMSRTGLKLVNNS